ALDQRQKIALHALTRYVTAGAAFARADFVDFIEENDAVVFDVPDGFLGELIGIEELVGFLVDQNFVGILHGDAASLGAAAAKLAEDVADGNRAHLSARHAGNVEQRQAATAARLHLDLNFLVVELAGAQLLAKGFLGRSAGIGADERIEHALLGGLLRTRLDVLAFAVAGQSDGDLDQVAHDLFDVAADIADLGEFRRLDLQKRRTGKLGEAARDLRLADTGRADHQNVLRQHLFAQPIVELQAPPAIA